MQSTASYASTRTKPGWTGAVSVTWKWNPWLWSSAFIRMTAWWKSLKSGFFPRSPVRQLPVCVRRDRTIVPRVLISDKLESPGLDLLRQAGVELDERHGLTGAVLQEALRAADGVIVRSGTRITAELLEDPGRLRAVVRAGVGVDNIDVAAATRHGIVVMNTPGGNTVSTAEHTLALLMSLARLIPAADAGMHQGKWERGKFVGTQLAGKTLGVIGLGRVGREVARRAAGFDMKVVGFDPFLSSDRAAQLGIESAAGLD